MMAEHVHHVARACAQEEAADAPVLVLQGMHDLSTAVPRPLVRDVDIGTSIDISGIAWRGLVGVHDAELGTAARPQRRHPAQVHEDV